MTLETVAASAARQNERGQHGQGCKNPLHLEPPFLSFAGSTGGKSGGLVGDLRADLGQIPVRHVEDRP
jgi:hypothetical protein